MTDINTWNAIDDSNNAAAPAGWPEGQMPSTVNNCARAMMGSLKRWRDQIQPTVAATGSPNAQIITYPVAPAALVQADCFTFTSVGTNTGPVTLQVNSQPSHPIISALSQPLVGGEMPAGAVIQVYWGGTNFRLLSDPGALKKTGDTMTGTLTVPNITYSGYPGHTWAFSWDGANTHVIVDGIDTGTIGDIASVSAGNGLTGGGTTGAISLAMSGSYSGNFTATGTVSANSLNTVGSYIFLNNATGIVNGTSTGCFLYGDASTFVLKYPNTNGLWMQNAAGATTFTINSAGSASVIGTMTAAQLTSTGNINAGASGTVTAQSFTGQIIRLNAIYDTLNQEALGITNDIVYMANTHTFNNKPNNQTFAYFNGGGCYNVNGGWGAFSDPALKENVEPYSRGLEAVRQLNPVTFRYRAGTPFASGAGDRPLLGLMADQVEPVVPEIVGETVVEVDGAERTMATLTPGNLVYALINAVKELSARVEQLETALVK